MSDVFRLIGNTPLVEVERLNPHRERGVRVLAKLESRNPGGSVKDRPARHIVLDAERRGLLGPDRPLLDATSGNTGIAYAMLCAARGYPCRLVLPANASPERLKILRAYGAELDLTDPLEGQDGAIDRARELAAREPDKWFYADQYSNPQNPLAHEETTGPEVWAQTGGRVTHLVAGLGTTGTLMGTARFLRRQAPGLVVASVEPAGPFHGIEGLKHLATSHVPGIFREAEAGTRLSVPTEEAQRLTRALAREEGLLVGGSSGAALAGALRVAAEAPAGSVVVTVFPDGGERYLAGELFSA
ncbi:MAG TPA: cysteine synthase family protein [Candidatus Thermoplasmatota archaeon]|nr:cysteine synthase family protein [Candidatus Thermoplasmatota archaeon]